jgi:zinc/manganese transport system permease protein
MNTLEIEILLPAFFAGLLVLLTHIPFGIKVLQRGVIFADLAVAQIAGLGVVIAGLLNLTDQPVWVQLIAATSALMGAGLLAWIERRAPAVKEACIGLTFVLAASAGILLMSGDIHAGEHLKDLLVGQILWVNTTQLMMTALLNVILLGVWYKFKDQFAEFGFYAVFALAVTASVQLVGIYLVFASLIVPALATFKMTSWRLPAAFAIGIAGYGLGLVVSVWLDWPSGATIVWVMALLAALPVLLKSVFFVRV